LSFAVAANPATSVLVTETVIHPLNEGTIVDELEGIDGTDFAEMQRDTELQRKKYNMQANQRLLVGIAWIYVGEHRLFRLFPKVFHVDATSHTNNEKRVLLTFSARTSDGRTFVFLRVFLPNQKAYSFRWVFQVVLVVLVGKETLEETELVISDGDSQECQQLDTAIDLYLPNARRARCGWHVAVKGWSRHCPSKTSVDRQHQARYDNLSSYIKRWIFSWMLPGYCETEQEFRISKALLIEFVLSKQVLEVCGGDTMIQRRIATFLTGYVLIYEEHFVFYRRKSVYHFNEYNNCAHEGTNFGAKSHAAQLLPSHTILQAGKTMVFQAAIKCKEIFVEAEKNMHSQKLWSDTPTAAHLTKLGESLVTTSWRRATQYKGARVSANQWEVEYASYSAENEVLDKEWEPIPSFRRVRVIDLLFEPSRNLWYLVCSCCNFERCGYGCSHIAWVLRHELGDSCKGFSHRDVSVHWLSSHFCYGHLSRTAETYNRVRSITVAMRYFQVNPVPGPLFPIERLTPFVDSISGSAHCEAMATVRAAPAKARLQNYSKQKVEQALAQFSHKVRKASGLETVTGQGIGNLTQESYVGVDMEEESSDDFSILGLKDNGVHDADFDNDSDNDDLDDNEQDGNAHSQQLQAFLQKVPDVESFKPRLSLKATMDEMLSVIEGTNRPQDHAEEAREMMREFTANLRAKCHDENTGKKRSAIVSYNQEREPKKCRQLVANHGIR
jgi:hypothetical protein